MNIPDSFMVIEGVKYRVYWDESTGQFESEPVEPEPINVGDTVIIKDEFGIEVEGIVISTKQYGTKGQYGVKTGGYGIYTRSREEIEKKK